MNISLWWSQLPHCSRRVRATISSAPISSAPRAVALAPRRVWSATLCAGECIRVRRGVVWLTQSGDAADYFLRAGESFTAPSRVYVVAQAMEESLLCVEKTGAALTR